MELETTRNAPAERPTFPDRLRYGLLMAQVKAAEVQLASLADQVDAAYGYVGRCAEETVRRAEQMAAMRVDAGTVAAHHDAASAMAAALDEARCMASALDALAKGFSEVASVHESEYGPVVESVRAMPVPMADRTFYANR